MQGVSKRYGGVAGAGRRRLRLRARPIHAVLGENGAGKSTLIKIIAGVVQPDDRQLFLDGQQVSFPTPVAANRAGIVCIFQELSLLPDLSVADNICITDPPRRFGLIDRRAQRRRAEELLARVGCEDVHPLERVRNLPLSRRQMVEIAKALGREPKLLILDEATSALTAADVEKVYAHAPPAARGRPGDPLHLAPHARDRGAGRRLLGVPQRPPHRDLRQGQQDRRRDRPADDRPRVHAGVPAQARARCGAGAGARGRAPELGRPAAGHLAQRRQGRDRRPRRPRRPGPARAAAGAVRRAARRRRQRPDRRPARSGSTSPAAGQVRAASAWR